MPTPSRAFERHRIGILVGLASMCIAVHVEAAERPNILRQAEILPRARNAPQSCAPWRHHFDVMDALRDAGSSLVDDVLA